VFASRHGDACGIVAGEPRAKPGIHEKRSQGAQSFAQTARLSLYSVGQRAPRCGYSPVTAGAFKVAATTGEQFMRALVWHGKEDIRCDTVSDPEIEDPRDAIVKVTSCAICGSDLHLFHNFIPAMLPGDIMGHEMMGEVVEVGSGVRQKISAFQIDIGD
jgi:alcohol dehydrogenase-like protein